MLFVLKTTLITLACALAAASCVGAPPHVQHARVNAKAHVYDVPLEEVWPFALQLMSENGFEIKKNEAREDGSRFSAESDWIPSGYGQVQLVVQGVRYADNSSQVSYTRMERALGETQVQLNRDLDMEWQLLRLIDPERAATIQQAGPPPEAEEP